MNKASEGRAALQGLQIHKAILQQRQLDFIRLKSDARLARIAARSGSDAAAAAESFLRPLVDETRMLRHNDQQSVRYFEDLSKELGQSATSKIGKIALKAEDFMGKSQLGRAILDKTLPFANHSFNHILNFAGVATAAWKAHEENPSLNGVERTVHTGMAAGFQFISTGLQVADPFIVLGARAFGASEKQAEGYTAGKFFSGLEQEFFAMGQAAWRHDSTPMDEWQQRAMSGAYGKVWQGYENTAYQLGAMGYNVATKVANVAGKVSQSYTKSLSWWEALGHARS